MTAPALGTYVVVARSTLAMAAATGWDDRFNGEPPIIHNLAVDRHLHAFALVRALGMKAVQAVVGHDFGYANCCLVRPDAAGRFSIMCHDRRTLQVPPRKLDRAGLSAPEIRRWSRRTRTPSQALCLSYYSTPESQ